MIKHTRGRNDGVIQKQGGNVVTYFCTPHGHVLHFVVGPIPSESLLASAQWSYTIYQHLLQQTEARETFEERRHWVKVQHENHQKDRRAKEKELLDELRKLRSQQRLDDNQVAGLHQTLRSLQNAYNAIQVGAGSKGHYLLSRYPLPLLGEIESLVFEKLAGESFSRRSHQLRDRILKNLQDERPILLVIANPTPQRRTSRLIRAEAARKNEPKLDDYFPKDVRVRRYLDAFHAEVLTRGELTAVTGALNQPPIPTRPGVWPTHVILDGQGEIAGVVTSRHSLNVLALLMEKYSIDEQDRPRAQTKSESPKFSPEQLARGDLGLAKYLLLKRQGNARERLKKIVVQYPDTESAFDALWLLARSGK